MYAAASVAAVIGVLHHWTPFVFGLYWAVGAVLNVPFLAAGELQLLARNRTVDTVVYVVLIFLAAYVVARPAARARGCRGVDRSPALGQARVR